MSKLVMVECVSMFRIRYVVETPDDHPEYAMDDVACGDPEEFDQEHLGETIVSHRVVTEEEVLAEFEKGNLAYCSGLDKRTKISECPPLQGSRK